MIETEPNGVPQHAPGSKLDAGKLPIRSLFIEYFPRAIASVARISDFGAKKYTPFGWEKVQDGIMRYGDAGARHALASVRQPAAVDEDSGMLHAAHEAWCALARLELILREMESNAGKPT